MYAWVFFAFFGSSYSDILKVEINIEGIGENDGSAVFYLGKCNIFWVTANYLRRKCNWHNCFDQN